MPLQYNVANGTYAWAAQTQRPAKPQGFSQQLLNRFLESDYANNTSLAAFVNSHPNAAAQGVLNQLHRRHVISWDLIKNFTAKAAGINWNQNFQGMTINIFQFFNVNPGQAATMHHGQPRAGAWAQLANSMCWSDGNIFIGPSAGNQGVAIDQGDELTDNERADLLAGAAWRGAAMVNAQMEGIIRG